MSGRRSADRNACVAAVLMHLACEMIRFLGHRHDFNDRDPAAQIRALRDIAKELSSPSWRHLGDAVTSYLDLVEATVLVSV
jgi:hypothetical protein